MGYRGTEAEVESMLETASSPGWRWWWPGEGGDDGNEEKVD